MESPLASKLTVHEPGPGGALIRIEGHLGLASLPELRDMLRSLEAPRVTFDLSGLMSLDAEGRSFLAILRDEGHVLAGASLYLSRLLEETSR